jgi:hypothetical protein
MAFNTDVQQEHAQPGYVASVDVPDAAAVTVYVHGGQSLTARTRALATKHHVHLTVRSWPFSMAELDAAARQGLAAMRAAGSAAIDVTAFSPDYAGITVRVPAGTGGSIRLASFSRPSNSSVGGVPVRVQEGSAGAAASRDSDFSPYNAGDAMFAQNHRHSHPCTTGFSVRYKRHNYVTTAQHCRQAGYRTLNDDTRKFGRTKKYSKTGQVRMMTATGGTKMWTGPWFGGSVRTVVGARVVSIGDQVCASGANSGTHCGITIDGTDLFNDGQSTGKVLTGSVKKGIATMEGDSGGPVYVPVPHSSTKVYAVGMIQEFLNSEEGIDCGVHYTAGLCAPSVGFTPIGQTLSGLKATLVHG